MAEQQNQNKNANAKEQDIHQLLKVRCSVYDGMFHVFQMGLDLIPESREAWEEVGEYLRIVYHIRRDQEGKVVKKVKTRRRDTEERAKLNLLAFLKRELKSK